MYFHRSICQLIVTYTLNQNTNHQTPQTHLVLMLLPSLYPIIQMYAFDVALVRKGSLHFHH